MFVAKDDKSHKNAAENQRTLTNKQQCDLENSKGRKKEEARRNEQKASSAEERESSAARERTEIESLILAQDERWRRA